MLNPENTMEQTYELLNELRVATEKNFVLKRLFWRVSNLLYLPWGSDPYNGGKCWGFCQQKLQSDIAGGR